MNLGGRRITNDALCSAVTSLGFANAQAFLASGNVIFDADGTPSSVSRRMSSGLTQALGYEVPTFIRSGKQIARVLSAEPFAERKSSNRGKVQVAFLERKPKPAAVRTALTLSTEEDWLVVDETELYWWPAGNMSASELDLAALAKLLGQMTIRTLRTVERLYIKFFDGS